LLLTQAGASQRLVATLPAGRRMPTDEDITALATELFDHIRTVHLGLGAGNATAARRAIAAAFETHKNLDRVADSRDRAVVGIILLAVLAERLDTLNAMVDQMVKGGTSLKSTKK
jgi:hypothetical protein